MNALGTQLSVSLVIGDVISETGNGDGNIL